MTWLGLIFLLAVLIVFSRRWRSRYVLRRDTTRARRARLRRLASRYPEAFE